MMSEGFDHKSKLTGSKVNQQVKTHKNVTEFKVYKGVWCWYCHSHVRTELMTSYQNQ